MIDNKQKQDCCGCGACYNICSHNAISMQPDNLGFLYPTIDAAKCVECGLCEKVCEFHPQYKRYANYETPSINALRLKSTDELEKSQSGGAFFAIAKQFIARGGVVYGADIDPNLLVKHRRVATVDDLQNLRLSKYVQSDITNVFKLVKSDLQQGIKVLFAGTSCQVAAIRSYIPERLAQNLYTIDIICHGAPSPSVWKDYVSYIESKYHSKIVSSKFRDKQFGWSKHQTQSFKLADGRIVFGKTSNNLYFGLYTIRDCCAKCPYTNTKRVGDISIGDYWGWERTPELKDLYDDNKGISIVMINSEKGVDVMDNVSHDATIIQTTTESYMQVRLKTPTLLNPKRAKFISDYNKHGFMYVAKRYGDLGWRWQVHTMIERTKDILRPIIRKR